MNFTSIEFIFIILPIFILIYSLIRNVKVKNIILLIFSLLFYAWGEPVYVLLLILYILFTYFFARIVKKHKALFILYICLAILPLLFFKYTNFIITIVMRLLKISVNYQVNALPIGISFYTFQAISYMADVYMGKIEVEKNILNLSTYLSLFPTITSGPIVRYNDIKENIKTRKFDCEKLIDGFRRFILGLIKKVVIANNVAIIADSIFMMDSKHLPVLLAWLGAIAYAIQIYYDFSGYSDMAIGISKMLGFELKENFNDPYISKSASEFWRRWHISLGSWFRDYIYIPLGGNRVSIKRWIFNIFVVWFLTGFWHGASFNYIGWGLYFGVLLILEKKLFNKFLEKHNVLSHIYGLLVVLIGWVIFRAPGIKKAAMYCFSMINVTTIAHDFDIISNDIIAKLVFLIVGILFVIPKIKYSFLSLKDKKPFIYDLILILLLALSIFFIENNSYSPFLYFKF